MRSQNGQLVGLGTMVHSMPTLEYNMFVLPHLNPFSDQSVIETGDGQLEP